MGPLQLLLICILSLSILVFVALFGRLPAFRRTPIGFFYRLLLLHIPRLLFKLDQLITNGRLTHAFKRTNHYLFYERHPIILIFFVGLLLGSEILFIPPSWSQISTIHRILIPVFVSLPYLFLYLGYTTQTLITHANHLAQMRHYPYDRTIFHPGAVCHTCQLTKPPRSKHCSLCKTCVSKMDHHCIWLNACVGRSNYIHFLLLLLSTSALTFYGAFLGWTILSSLSPYPLRPTTAFTQPHFWNVLSMLIARYSRLGAVTILTTLSSPLPAGLLAYHVYLLWAGMTTNESEKWGDLRDDIVAGIVWKANRMDLMEDYPPLPAHVEPPLGEVTWPIEPKWWICRMRPGERPRRWAKGESEGAMVPGDEDDRWERVESLREVVNVYDLGFWENLGDCIWNRN